LLSFRASLPFPSDQDFIPLVLVIDADEVLETVCVRRHSLLATVPESFRFGDAIGGWWLPGRATRAEVKQVTSVAARNGKQEGAQIREKGFHRASSKSLPMISIIFFLDSSGSLRMTFVFAPKFKVRPSSTIVMTGCAELEIGRPVLSSKLTSFP
jgi:hypothetical protein